jgi:hypothetical protein
MDGMDLQRRMGWSRAAAKAWAGIAPLLRRQPRIPPVTAADCVRIGKVPLRRLEPLRRRTGAAR